jgi:hypothetical protein
MFRQRQLAKLGDKFPNLFRATKLISRRVSFSDTPSLSPKAPSYAATIASPIDTTAVTINSSKSTPTNTNIPARKNYPVLQNSKGQRLDVIFNLPQTLVNVLRNKKLATSTTFWENALSSAAISCTDRD